MQIEQLKTQKVLVIDDTVTIHKLMSHQLEDLGFPNVTCAISAMAAWDILEADSTGWGAIFCDLNMPEISGIEFLKRIRADERFQDIIFIMLTMESDIKLVNESIEAGVNGYVLKPYTKSTILKCLEQALNALEDTDQGTQD